MILRPTIETIGGWWAWNPFDSDRPATIPTTGQGQWVYLPR
jgi:hypothetical protein